MKLPTMDIVIPAFNEETQIEECLLAIIAQKANFNKIIVVDNNSTDDTVKIVRELQKKCSKIVLLHEKKAGVWFARDHGFNYATADIIGRIDADTRIQPGWAREIRLFLSQHRQFAAVCGKSDYYDLPCKRLCDFFSWFSTFFANEFIGGEISLYGANMAIRNKTWKTIKPKLHKSAQDKIMEDLDMSIVCHKLGLKIAWVQLAEAKVSGRRFLMSRKTFYKYDRRWWMTYIINGNRLHGYLTRFLSCWIANAIHFIGQPLFRCYDHETKTWSIQNYRDKKCDRSFQ